MQLIEVMVAGTIFLGASFSSLQICAVAGNSAQQWAEHRQALEQSETDRVLLEAHWRRTLGHDLACDQTAAAMASTNAAPAPRDGMQRSIQLNPDRQSLTVTWQGDEGFNRRRLVAPAALGLCSPAQEVPA